MLAACGPLFVAIVYFGTFIINRMGSPSACSTDGWTTGGVELVGGPEAGRPAGANAPFFPASVPGARKKRQARRRAWPISTTSIEADLVRLAGIDHQRHRLLGDHGAVRLSLGIEAIARPRLGGRARRPWCCGPPCSEKIVLVGQGGWRRSWISLPGGAASS